jgi:hypothetical protein
MANLVNYYMQSDQRVKINKKRTDKEPCLSRWWDSNPFAAAHRVYVCALAQRVSSPIEQRWRGSLALDVRTRGSVGWSRLSSSEEVG